MKNLMNSYFKSAATAACIFAALPTAALAENITANTTLSSYGHNMQVFPSGYSTPVDSIDACVNAAKGLTANNGEGISSDTLCQNQQGIALVKVHCEGPSIDYIVCTREAVPQNRGGPALQAK